MILDFGDWFLFGFKIFKIMYSLVRYYLNLFLYDSFYFLVDISAFTGVLASYRAYVMNSLSFLFGLSYGQQQLRILGFRSIGQAFNYTDSPFFIIVLF